MKLTFTRYLKTQIKKNDRVGDFARDWIKDESGKKPRGYKHWNAVESYLSSQGACQAAIDSGKDAWEEWKECVEPPKSPEHC